MSSDLVLELKSVGKSFAALRALDGVSIALRSGEIYGLLGPNGAGKSTTINVICGLLRPDAGSVHAGGFDMVADPLQAKKAIGVVPQELALYTELDAKQNLRFFGRLYGLEGRALETRIDHLLELVRLTARSREPVSVFSGGMQRRLNIAAGLLHNPKLVLMDEPTVGLDPQNRTNILEIVQALAAEGAAVLYSTHYMEEVETICSRIGIIDHGKLLAEGGLDELRRQAGGKEILTLRGSFETTKAQDAIKLKPDERILRGSQEELVLELVNADSRLSDILRAVSETGTVREVFMNRQSLESLFIQLTGRELRE